jgi:hypothetical protein
VPQTSLPLTPHVAKPGVRSWNKQSCALATFDTSSPAPACAMNQNFAQPQDKHNETTGRGEMTAPLLPPKTHIGVSLGWNCHSAMWAVERGLRDRRVHGYKTCPFDECISNIDGVIACFRNDFKDFTNPEHLTVVNAPFSTGGIRQGERLLMNTKYKFIFNHESPGHADLYIKQGWAGGSEHFIDNDFSEFRRRYDARIGNLRAYLADAANSVTFVVTQLSSETEPLRMAIQSAYPHLAFDITSLEPRDTPEVVRAHHELMGVV